uniref:Guanylate cyclase n=1 Tax=Panagrolaimus sp. JU765 TaxID=591449 RepID=A0AC34Q5T6_9BILA
MLGWIHNCAKRMVTAKYGEETWIKALEMCDIDVNVDYDTKKNYDDSETFRIFRSLAKILEMSSDDLYEMFGTWVVKYAMETGWDKLLFCMADSLHDFLDNLNSMHFFIDQIAFQTEMRGPLFKCETNNDGTLRLHYYSVRKGLFPMVKGLVLQSAKALFNLDVKIFVTERSQEKRNNLMTEHVIYTIEPLNELTPLVKEHNNNLKSLQFELSTTKPALGISLQSFAQMFPMHVCFNKQMIIEHCGEFLQQELNLGKRRMTKLTDIFQLIQPEDVQISFKGFLACLNSLFIFQLKTNLARNDKNDSSKRPLVLKGQMMVVNNGQNLLFVASIHITTIRGLLDSNVFISDMKMHDVTRDLIMLNQSRICQQELNKRLEETVKELRKLAEELEQKKEQTDHLLFERIPPEIAEKVRQKQTVISQEFSESTCMMVDIPHFPIINSQCEPKDIITLMSNLFCIYDRLIDIHGCYKVLSIMDCYFVISGVPKPVADHTDRILNLALGFMMEAKQLIVPKLNLPVLVRIIVHSGPVVAGVLGKTKIRYGVMGETVNVTKRLLMHAEPGKILVTNSAKINGCKSTTNNFEFLTKGFVNIGNKQATCTFFLDKNIKKSIWEIIGREKEDHHTNDGYRELHLASDLQNWIDVELNVRKQENVIAAMQTKSSHFSIAADKIKRMREAFRSHHHSDDSGVSSSSGNEISSICSIM